MKVLMIANKDKSVLIDSENRVLAWSDLPASSTFSLMKFAQSKHHQYGLNSIKSVKDLDRKLDKGISSMEIEIALKKEKIKNLRK